jgi:cell division protein FtsA
LEVTDIILQQLASSEAALTPEEKELGVALVDIGGGTTDIAIFHQGSIKHTSVISLAGDHVTGDIAIGLRTPIEEAEKIKKKHGCALTSLVAKDERVEVPAVGERAAKTISKYTLAEIIEPRMEEILSLAQREILNSGYEGQIASGIVLSGGSALLEGVVDLAEQIFSLPVRKGAPRDVGGLTDIVSNPIYTTAVGLVLYGQKGRISEGFVPGEANIFDKVTRRMKGWFKEFF